MIAWNAEPSSFGSVYNSRNQSRVLSEPTALTWQPTQYSDDAGVHHHSPGAPAMDSSHTFIPYNPGVVPGPSSTSQHSSARGQQRRRRNRRSSQDQSGGIADDSESDSDSDSNVVDDIPEPGLCIPKISGNKETALQEVLSQWDYADEGRGLKKALKDWPLEWYSRGKNKKAFAMKRFKRMCIALEYYR